jgi:hypothetical protein
MKRETFDAGIKLIGSRLGTPADAARIKFWTDGTFKALESMSDLAFEAVAQAAFEELKFWNEFSAKWCRDKARDLRIGDPVALPPAREEPAQPLAFPPHVKAWLYHQRIWWLRLSPEEKTQYRAATFRHPGQGRALPYDVATSMAEFKDAIAAGAVFPEISNPLSVAARTVDAPLF